ncbi:MAG: hypothetical protein KDA52_12835, partial [Planctomycetaceae bacterium]|nr:hypothetical protein [Planctomycetaceae bacterium]
CALPISSAHAGTDGGQLTTKPLTFSGSKLVINYTVGEGGSVQVELLQEDGTPYPGYDLAAAPSLTGDEIVQAVTWTGKDNVSELKGKPVQIRFHLKNADLYSLRFQD